jgi:hypothetical protein
VSSLIWMWHISHVCSSRAAVLTVSPRQVHCREDALASCTLSTGCTADTQHIRLNAALPRHSSRPSPWARPAPPGQSHRALCGCRSSGGQAHHWASVPVIERHIVVP